MLSLGYIVVLLEKSVTNFLKQTNIVCVVNITSCSVIFIHCETVISNAFCH